WAFPVIDGASTSTSVNGSSAPGVNGSVGYMQPAGSRGTASCAWQFGQGAAAPAPPSILAAQAIPIPSSTAQRPAVPSQSAATATTTGSTTGIRVIGSTSTTSSGDASPVPIAVNPSGPETMRSSPIAEPLCALTSCSPAQIAAAFDNFAQGIENVFALIMF